MSSTEPPTTDAADRLAELLVRWEDAWEHGEDIPAEQLCTEHPDLVEPLRRQIEVLKKMAWMKGSDDSETNIRDRLVIDDPLLSKTLGGRYRVDVFLAEGGFGRVYRGYDPELDRPVAIKIPKVNRVESSERTGALLQEARRVAKLHHPGIVPIHDVGRDEGVWFFVSDLVEGENLADLMARQRPNHADAARLVAEIADNLHVAHEQGFVHRDIKPSNILIDNHGKPQITDFGIAVTTEEISDRRVPKSGTLPYMAPEQVAGEVQLISPGTDIYALGVVLFELLTGRLPYQARTPTAMREQILLRPPVGPRAVDKSIPARLEAICLRCLAKHPADRFTSAAELAQGLRSVKGKSAARRLTWVAVASAILILSVLAVVGRILVTEKGNPTSTDTAARNNAAATARVQVPAIDGALVFDQSYRIRTPLERFAPVTLEAWVKPARFRKDNHFVIGSDVVTRFGNSLGISGAVLAAQYIPGLIQTDQIVPLDRWSHIAAVFGATETRLYFDGKQVAKGPSTSPLGGTVFVIGSVGETTPVGRYEGQIRCLRISRGERFKADFAPEETFGKDLATAPSKAVLIYDGRSVAGDRVLDLSGEGNDGIAEKIDSPAEP